MNQRGIEGATAIFVIIIAIVGIIALAYVLYVIAISWLMLGVVDKGMQEHPCSKIALEYGVGEDNITYAMDCVEPDAPEMAGLAEQAGIAVPSNVSVVKKSCTLKSTREAFGPSTDDVYIWEHTGDLSFLALGAVLGNSGFGLIGLSIALSSEGWKYEENQEKYGSVEITECGENDTCVDNGQTAECVAGPEPPPACNNNGTCEDGTNGTPDLGENTGNCPNDCPESADSCGNDIIGGTEECDGIDFGGKDCMSETGLELGDLTCTEDCEIDASACTSCGNEICENGTSETPDLGENPDTCPEDCPSGL